MTRKARRLQVLDQLAPPDLWPDIRGREPRRPPEEPRGVRRVVVAALALAVAAAAVAFAVRAFEVGERSPRPASTVANGRIAFVSETESDLYIHGAQSGIFLIDPDGSGRSALIDDPTAFEWDPAWSPDGTKLAFGLGGDAAESRTGLYVANSDGSGVRLLLEDSSGPTSPSWSSDGREIVFESGLGHEQTGSGNRDVYSIDVESGELTRLTDDPARDEYPALSPNGTKIAFTRQQDGVVDIYVMNADGAGVIQLTRGEGEGFRPAWSPDGTKIAFERNAHIYVMNADGTGVMRLTEGPAEDGEPAWSPDGTKIAFGRDADIYIMNADGTEVTRLHESPRIESSPAWQPIPVAMSPGPTSSPTPSPSPSMEAVVAATTTVGADGAVRSVAYGEGGVWVAVTGEPSGPGTVLRIHPETDEIVATIPVDAVPGWEVGGAGMTIGAGSVWVTGSVEDPSDPPIGTDAVLVRIDPASNEVSATISLGGGVGGDVAVDESGVWVAVGDQEQGELVHVDPATNEIVARIQIPYKAEPYQDLREVVTVGGIVLVNQPTFENGGGAITVVDAATNQALATSVIRVPEDIDSSIGPLVEWSGQVWADNGYQLVRIDPRTGHLLGEAAQLPGALAGGLLTSDDRGLWFLGYNGRTGSEPRTLSLFDPETGAVQMFVDVPGIAPNAMAVGPGSAWVLDYHGTLTRIQLP